jgi:hypothetical protein
VLALSFSLESESSVFLPRYRSDRIEIIDNFKVVVLPYGCPDSVLPSLRDIDLQADALCDLALLLVLEFCVPPYRCSFHDRICSENHRTEFDRKHGRAN